MPCRAAPGRKLRPTVPAGNSTRCRADPRSVLGCAFSGETAKGNSRGPVFAVSRSAGKNISFRAAKLLDRTVGGEYLGARLAQLDGQIRHVLLGGTLVKRSSTLRFELQSVRRASPQFRPLQLTRTRSPALIRCVPSERGSGQLDGAAVRPVAGRGVRLGLGPVGPPAAENARKSGVPDRLAGRAGGQGLKRACPRTGGDRSPLSETLFRWAPKGAKKVRKNFWGAS